MTDSNEKKTLIQVKGSLIVDVIAELVSAGRKQELRDFVEANGIIARFDTDTIASLKTFLRFEISHGSEEAFSATRRAERSAEPCMPDNG